MGRGGDRIGGSVEEAVAKAFRAIGSRGGLDDLIELLSLLAKLNIEILFRAATADMEMEHVAWLLLGRPTIGATGDISIVPAKDDVANLKAAGFGVAVRLDGNDGKCGVRLVLEAEAECGANGFFFFEREAGLGEQVNVGQWLRTADVSIEKVL